MLTKAMVFALERAKLGEAGMAPTAWLLGRATCEALRKRGLIEGEHPITRWGVNSNPYIYLTEAGRRALQGEGR